MAKLFVSYSRKDSKAAHRLIESFKSIEQEVWVDWESIPPAVDWLEQIFRGIETADAFIFMISPDSIASEVCNVEVGRAALNNKRIIPIVLRDVSPRDSNEIIRKLNWTFIRETDNFDEGLAKVKTAIELDLDWLEEHRRLQVRALEWHRKKDVSLLLRGRDLRNAEHMVQTYTSKDPIPTELQLKYIDHSRKTERNRTFAWIATGIAVIAMAILSIAAYQQSLIAKEQSAIAQVNENFAKEQEGLAKQQQKLAEENEQKAIANEQEAVKQKKAADEQRLIAQSQRSAAKAQIYQIRTGELYTSTLLAIDSWEKTPSDEAEEILRKNISLLPIPVVQTSDNGNINALEMNPNGDTYLTASGDDTGGAACMRNLKDGKQLFCETSSTSMNDAIFALGGKSIVIADQAGVVKVLNAENGNVEREFEPGPPVRDLDTDSTGKMLAIARVNGNITIVNLQIPKDKGYNLKLTGTLTAADFSPDGKQVAAGSEAGTVTVWNLNNGKIFSSGRHKGGVIAIRFSPNGRFVISGGADNYAAGIDTQTGEEIFRLLHSDWVKDIAFAGNGSWFTTASDDARVRVWDLNTGKERLIMFQEGAITDVKISADGKWIATTGEDETVRVWSSYTGVEMFQIPLENYGVVVGFSNDGKYLVSSDGDGNISVWDISGMNAPTSYIQFDKLTWISKFTPSGDSLIAADANRVWALNPKDLTNRGAGPRSTATLEFRSDIYDLVISPDSKLIGISTYEDEYFIANIKTGSPVRVKPSGAAYALAFTPDGSRFITGTEDGNIQTWDLRTGNMISSLNIEGYISSIATAPTQIAAAMTDQIVILDANAEQKVSVLDAPGDNKFASFNADGSILAVANSSGQVLAWKTQNGKYEPIEIKSVHQEQPYSIALNPQGDLLAVATTNNVYLIDTTTGEEANRIPHKGIVYNVSFSPDGKTLATASLKMIQLWDVTNLPMLKTGQLKDRACSRLIRNFSLQEWTALFGQEEYRVLCDNLQDPRE